MEDFVEVPASKKSLAKRKPVFGIGINDADYITEHRINGKQLRCPFYRTWVGVLERCYANFARTKYPTYQGCTICDEWKLFSNFKNWMIEQDWKNKELDKDLLIIGNKIYSPNTCMFVTSTINKLIGVHGFSKNTYAIGVSWSKRNNKYRADCDVQGKQQYLGLYLTEEEASQVYRACKKEVIICVANQQSDLKLKSALHNIANNLSSH